MRYTTRNKRRTELNSPPVNHRAIENVFESSCSAGFVYACDAKKWDDDNDDTVAIAANVIPCNDCLSNVQCFPSFDCRQHEHTKCQLNVEHIQIHPETKNCSNIETNLFPIQLNR